MAKGSVTPDGPRPAWRGSSLDAGAVVDPRGVVVALSPDLCRLLGYEPAEVVGRPADGLLAEAEALPDALRRAWAERESWSGRVGARARGGHVLSLTLRAQPLRDGTGETYCMICCRRPGRTTSLFC
jgi:PAS domain S-box-containing protein